jgi:hypothetical protein
MTTIQFKLIGCALIFLLSFPLSAQDSTVYHLSLKRELMYGGSGVLTMAGGEFLRRQIQPVNISTLEFEDIIELDELPFVYGRHRAEKLSDYSMYASAGLMSLFLTRPRNPT